MVDQKYLLAPHLYKEKRTNLTDDAVPTIFEHTTVGKPRLSSEARSRKRRRIEVSNFQHVIGVGLLIYSHNNHWSV